MSDFVLRVLDRQLEVADPADFFRQFGFTFPDSRFYGHVDYFRSETQRLVSNGLGE